MSTIKYEQMTIANDQISSEKTICKYRKKKVSYADIDIDLLSDNKNSSSIGMPTSPKRTFECHDASDHRRI